MFHQSLLLLAMLVGASAHAALPKHTYFWTQDGGDSFVPLSFGLYEFDPAATAPARPIQELIAPTQFATTALKTVAVVGAGTGSGPFVVAKTDRNKAVIIRHPQKSIQAFSELSQLSLVGAVAEAREEQALVVGADNELFLVGRDGTDLSISVKGWLSDRIIGAQFVERDVAVFETVNAFYYVDISDNPTRTPKMITPIRYLGPVSNGLSIVGALAFKATPVVLWALVDVVDAYNTKREKRLVAWDTVFGNQVREITPKNMRGRITVLSVDEVTGDVLVNDDSDYVRYELATGKRVVIEPTFFHGSKLMRNGLRGTQALLANVDFPQSAHVWLPRLGGARDGTVGEQLTDVYLEFLLHELRELNLPRPIGLNTTVRELVEVLNRTLSFRYHFKEMWDNAEELAELKKMGMVPQGFSVACLQGHENDPIELRAVASLVGRSYVLTRTRALCQKELAPDEGSR